jgi:hypothetical protein
MKWLRDFKESEQKELEKIFLDEEVEKKKYSKIRKNISHNQQMSEIFILSKKKI